MATPADRLLKGRLSMSLAATLAALVILLLVGLPLYTAGKYEETPSVAGDEDDDDTSDARSPEFRAIRCLCVCAALLTVSVMLFPVFRESLGSENILDYVLKGNWENGLNVFALTAALISICKTGVVIFLFRRLMRLLSDALPVRGRSIVRVLTSLVAYAGWMFMAYRFLVYMGMEPTTLMASAGIVSVVIGIGANSLVGDVIAGMFLLAEGNIQVGDMIEVGDFLGIVEELGIRVTKIYHVENRDVKIIPNKEIQNVLHLSRYPACLHLGYMIEYREDLERVEKLLCAELATLQAKMPELTAPPEYKGVQTLGDNGVVLRVDVRCHEAHRPDVTRKVNRSVYMMFCRNGISVPFPQITVHNADAQSD